MDDLELMDAIRDAESPAAIVLWLQISRSEYTELISRIQEQLEAVTKGDED